VYLKKLTISQTKCFESLTIDFPHQGDDYSGWIVLLGANGTGKSTLLQAMALALIGPVAVQQLFKPQGWVRQGADYSTITAEIVRGKGDVAGGAPRKAPYEPELWITGEKEVTLDEEVYAAPQIVLGKKERTALVKGIYAAKRAGWFSCGYGPFRRLSGGTEESEIVYSTGREARVASLFRESVALTRCNKWLTTLYSNANDPNLPGRDQYEEDLDVVKGIINDLLPKHVNIAHVNSRDAVFKALGGAEVPMSDLSDGYRSFLALAVDMLRHIQDSNQGLLKSLGRIDSDGFVVDIEGVVLIDEADVHLHPLWQRDIGRKLRQVFPKIQFIVTSHSPFIAQTATDGGLFVLRQEKEKGPVGVTQPELSVKGWRADQILLSPLFGLTETRGEEIEGLLSEHTALIGKKAWQVLTTDEQKRLAELDVRLSETLTAPGETLEDREREQAMGRFVDETLKQLGGNGDPA
jgi:hypothetical protein